MSRTYLYPDALVSTEWLATQRSRDDLRIFECTMYLNAPDLNTAYQVVSGRDDFLAGHIPGAAFLDLQADCSDTGSAYRFTMPSPERFAKQIAAAGVSSDSQVVLYARGNMQWASRIWWMLRSIGFDRAALLDGGWEKWQREQRPVATGEHQYRPGQLTAKARPGLFVGSAQVLDAIDNPDVTILNALSAELHQGHSSRYGRPGRIPDSINVPAADLRDAAQLTLVPAEVAARRFDQAGLPFDKQVIIYCGGGIAATLDAFVLHQLGHQQIAVYDNSLNEWSNRPELPMASD